MIYVSIAATLVYWRVVRYVLAEAILSKKPCTSIDYKLVPEKEHVLYKEGTVSILSLKLMNTWETKRAQQESRLVSLFVIMIIDACIICT